MSKPLFVAISDIHFNINNLQLASKSLQVALSKAEELNIPLVIAGDLNDTKAIIRAEVANAIISILENSKIWVIILEGNHDKVNEKSSEHSLNYLRPYATILDEPETLALDGGWNGWVTFIPYMTDTSNFSLSGQNSNIVVMHQGFRGAFMGDYIQDKSSMSTDIVKDYTVISGHYHRHQTLGTVTYIGSPYTITYGEANDGPKGFLIVNEDGTFTREILNLRKHIILERNLLNRFDRVPNYNPGDLVRIKLRGTRKALSAVDKHELGQKLFGHSNFSLDLISEDPVREVDITPMDLTDHELMLQLIEDTEPGLKETYLEVLNETNQGRTR